MAVRGSARSLAAPALLIAGAAMGIAFARHRSLPLMASGAVLAVIGGLLMGRAARIPPLLSAVIGAAGIALICNGVASDVGWFAFIAIAGWCVLVGGAWDGPVCWALMTLLFVGEWIWSDDDAGWVNWIAGVTLITVAALLIRRQRQLVAQLREAQAGLARQARIEERNRIARELHDVIAHSLVVSLLHVTSARLALEHEPADAARALAEAERLGRECLTEVRRTVGLVRDDSSAHGSSTPPGGRAAPLPGAADVPALIEQFRSAGVRVTSTIDPVVVDLPPTAGLAVYRILQEAMTNAARHAPGQPVDIQLTAAPDRIQLTVESSGPSGLRNGLGHGLVSMQERAQALGGSCQAGPSEAGWTVHAELPHAVRPAEGLGVTA